LRNLGVLAQTSAMVIDDFTDDGLVSELGTRWRGVSDDGARGASGKEVERAEDLLDRLDQIRVGLLTGSMSRGTLNSIVARL
jgi:hypothetical protein